MTEIMAFKLDVLSGSLFPESDVRSVVKGVYLSCVQKAPPAVALSFDGQFHCLMNCSHDKKPLTVFKLKKTAGKDKNSMKHFSGVERWVGLKLDGVTDASAVCQTTVGRLWKSLPVSTYGRQGDPRFDRFRRAITLICCVPRHFRTPK